MSEQQGLPLAQAVLRFQLPRASQDSSLASASIVQQLCEIAMGMESRFQVEFDPDDECFDVFELFDDWQDGERVRALIGLFRVGDDRMAAYSEPDDGGPLAEPIAALIARLHHLLLASLKNSQLRVWARRDDPFGARILVPADVFKLCEIEDWDRGVAALIDGTKLLDLRIESVSSSADADNKATAADETAAVRVIARMLLSENGLTRPEAQRALVVAGIVVSGNGFQNRVWPKARKAAGLSEKAPAGRRNRCPLIDYPM